MTATLPRILQIVPAAGFRAVYGSVVGGTPRGAGEGVPEAVELAAHPLAGFALVEDGDGGRSVVGLDPRDFVYLCDEIGDFLGYLAPGEDLAGEAGEEFRRAARGLAKARAETARRTDLLREAGYEPSGEEHPGVPGPPRWRAPDGRAVSYAAAVDEVEGL